MSEFGFEQDGEKAIEETVDGTLQNEVLKVTAEGFTPPVKKPRKPKPIKVEEAVPPFELPEAKIVIEEQLNVEVVEQQVETIVPEAEIKQAESTPAPEAAKQVKVFTPSENRGIVKQLRARDPDHKRTCASCLRRVPIVNIGATGEICDDCK